MKVIDMKIEAVREAVLHGGESAVDMYRSNIAVEYEPRNVHGTGRR
jgi:hypothetical protein